MVQVCVLVGLFCLSGLASGRQNHDGLPATSLAADRDGGRQEIAQKKRKKKRPKKRRPKKKPEVIEDIEDVEDVEDIEDIEDVENVEDVEKEEIKPEPRKEEPPKPPEKKPEPPKEKPPPPPQPPPPPPAKKESDYQSDQMDMDVFVELDVDDEFALLEEEIKVDEVESASKHRQSIFWSPSAITVLTREDIQMSGATSVTDLLRRVPGFDIYEMKASFPLVGARALTDDSNNLILVLVDGREPLIEFSGWPIWAAFTFDIEEIERIEVIRGPGSSLYGANAFAGVVSITTVRERPETGGDVYLSAGDQGQRRLFGRARGGWSLGDGNLDFSAGLATQGRLSASDRENQIVYTDFQTHGYVRYRRGKDLSLALHGGYLVGGGPIYFIVGDVHTRNIVNHFEMLKAEFGLDDKIQLYAQLYHSRFGGDLHYRTPIESLGTWLANLPDFDLDHNTLDGQVQLDYQILDDLLAIAGGNIRYTSNRCDTFIPKESTEVRGAGFLNVQWSPLDEIQLSAGLRADLNNKTRAALSPRAVAVFRPWPDHAFRLGYGLAFRKPSLAEYNLHVEVEEMAFPEVEEKFATAVGNAGLVNEKVQSIEAGWRARFFGDALRVSADLFYNTFQDMIYFETELMWDTFGRPDLPRSTFEYRNEETDVSAFGGEVEMVIEPARGWLLWGNLGLRWVADEDGNQVPSEPTLRANLGGRWISSWGPVADLSLHYVSEYEMPVTRPKETFDEPAWQELGNRLLAMGRIGYRHRLGESRKLEAGISFRAPIGGSFREFAGLPLNRTQRTVTGSDFGGERLVRLLSVYLRGSF